MCMQVYDSPCVLQPPMSSKGGVYIYLKFAVMRVHFTNNVRVRGIPIYLIIFNLDYSVIVRSPACYRSL